MIVILKWENLWNIVEIKKVVSLFFITILGKSYLETRLAKAKQRTLLGLTMSIADSSISTIFQYIDLVDL